MLRDSLKLSEPPPPDPPTVSETDGGGMVLTYAQMMPYRDRGILMVPIRSVLTAAKVPFTYDARTKVITIMSAFGVVKHWGGTNRASVAGQSTLLETPSDMVSGTMYVPEELVEIAVGKSISWDRTNRQLMLK
jgi:hypothetical protein